MIHQPSVQSRDQDEARPVGKRVVLGGARVLSTFVLAVTAVVPIGADPAFAATPCPAGAVQWTAPGDGEWTDAANWTGGMLPTGNDDVCLPAVTVSIADAMLGTDAFAGRLFSEGTLRIDEFAVIDLNGPSEVERLLLMGTVAGTGSLTILGTGSNWSDGTIDNDFVVAEGADLEISGFNVRNTNTLNGSLTNDGTVFHSGINLRAGIVVNNGSWLLTHASRAVAMREGSFTNNGTLERPAGHGGDLTEFISGVDFFNHGTVIAGDGMLQIANLVVLGDGASMIAGTGAELRVSSFDGAAIGNATIDGDGAVEFRQGNYSINPGAVLTVVDAFVLAAGSIHGPGTLGITGEGTLAHGEIAGTAVVEPAGHLSIDPSLVNAGHVDISGELVNNGLVTQPEEGLFAGTNHGAVTNNALWQFTNTGTTNFLIRGLDGTGSFINNGTLEGSDVGNSGLHQSLDLENNGTVVARSGLFRIRTATANLLGTTLSGGRWEVRNGSSMQLPGAVTTNDAEVLLSGTGAASTELGDLTDNTGSFELADGASFTTAGSFTNDGTIVTGSGSTFAVSGALTLGATSTIDFGVGGATPNLIGQITAVGAATLGGTLGAHTVGGFVPAVNESYQVMSYASQGGAFAAFAVDPFFDADVQATATFLIGLDPEPIADAGGDQVVSEGEGAVLDGSQSTDPGGMIDTWSWTPATWFINDMAPMPTFIHTDDDGVFTVTLRVCDTAVQCDEDQATITVTNVAPTVFLTRPSLAGPAGSVITVDGTYQDPGVADTHTATIDWKDQSIDIDVPVNGGTFSFDHTYTTPGTYSVDVCIEDDDGGADCDVVSIEAEPPANTPPTVDPGGPYTASEGQTITIEGTAVDGDIGDMVVSTEWTSDPVATLGDPGATRTGFQALQDGTYDLTLSATDTRGDTGSATTQVVVSNARPDITSRVFVDTFEGAAVQFHATYSDPGVLDVHTARVNWFDPNAFEPAVVDQDANTVFSTHIYPQDRISEVNLCVADELVEFCNSTLITISNVAPEIAPFALSGPRTEGSTIELSATITDPGTLDPLVTTIDWGEGADAQQIAPTNTATGGTIEASNLYEQNGSYTIRICATDDHDTTCRSETVAIGNVVPDVEAGPDLTVDAGDPVSLAAFFDDPGADTWTATVLWGDATPQEQATIDPSKAITGQHAYNAAGSYTATVCVFDGTGTGCDSFDVSVNAVVEAVPPVADAGGPYSGSEGGSIGLDGSKSGDADGMIVSYEWSANGGGFDDPNSVMPRFRADDDGSFTVTLTVTDDDGLTDTTTATVEVRNVNPSVNAGEDRKINKGDRFGLDAEFSDPGKADTHRAVIDWGDGVRTTLDHTGSPIANGHRYDKPGQYRVTVTVIDDDGGGNSDTLTVTVEHDAGGGDGEKGAPRDEPDGEKARKEKDHDEKGDRDEDVDRDEKKDGEKARKEKDHDEKGDRDEDEDRDEKKDGDKARKEKDDHKRDDDHRDEDDHRDKKHDHKRDDDHRDKKHDHKRDDDHRDKKHDHKREDDHRDKKNDRDETDDCDEDD